MASVDLEFGRRLRDQHPIGVSDDDEAIADLLDSLMGVDFEREKPVTPTLK